MSRTTSQRLIAHAATADLVIGSRYIYGGSIENWSRRRVILSTFANRYVWAITRLKPRDCTSGFRCWRREALMRLPLDRIASNGYAFQVEMAWEAAAADCRTLEVPIHVRRAAPGRLQAFAGDHAGGDASAVAAHRTATDLVMSLSRKSVPRYDSRVRDILQHLAAAWRELLLSRL